MPIDERAVEWLRLLPPTTRFAAADVPPSLRGVLAERLGPQPNAYLGWRVARPDLSSADAFDAMVLINSSGRSVRALREVGFGRTLGFSVLPSLADPRVFAPLDNPRVAARALDFITVYRPRARLARALALLLARAGQLGRVGDRVVLARRTDSELERWLRSATTVSEVCLAISPGGISYKRKLTIQVMAPDGRVLAFSKVADAPAARRATEQESTRLLELAAYRAVIGSIPRLIDRTTIGDTFVTLLSPGPARLAPATFGSPHWDFLQALAAQTERVLAFEHSTMWAAMRATFESLEPHLSAAWQARLATTLARLGAMLGQRVLPLHLAHRDFQPGNMRQFPTGRLFVYDWEGAQPESTPLYDFFNFNFGYTFRRGAPRIDRLAAVLDLARGWCPKIDPRDLPMLFAAYLTDHALRRLTNSDLGRDRGSVVVLDAIAALLDRQGEWLGESDRVARRQAETDPARL
jgi:hypothetical protein